MTEEALATKAPESDAAEDAVKKSPFPGDSVAQEGPSMGDHCVTDRPTPAGAVPTGEISQLGGIETYITKPADYPHAPSKLLLLLTGGTGLKSTNNQLQADKFAAEGFLVIMPDQFGGDPASGNSVTQAGTENTTWLERFKVGIADTAKSFMIDMWLARHTPEKVLPILHKVIEGAKDEFADAIANGGGIYAIGYCFGAKYVLLLGGEHPDPQPTEASNDDEEEQSLPVAKGPFIKAGAIAHGTQITSTEMGKLKVPTILICVENDPLFPDHVRTAGIQAMETAQVEHEIKVYPEVPHGFAVLGDYEEANIKTAQQAAFAQVLGWLQAH